MSENNRNLRIRTKVGRENKDKYVNVNLNSDIGILEILSLKIDTSNFYKRHTSDYGCIAGRVLANGGVGIPNAKISVFVSLDDAETADPVISVLYPYSYVYGKNNDGIKYNLLPNEEVSECHTPVGTFPSKRMVLDDDNYVEIFEKYYKYTTRSNDSGDYMLFGIPVGEKIVHVDIDLSDIGMLSQRPRDMIYKGYNITQFENANKFKSDTNLDNLTQLISQSDSINVYPFWGDSEQNEIKITRHDIDVQYKFEPTCIFLGSLITDEKSQGVSHKCIPTDRMGKMNRITTGCGTIEMIRKTPDGEVEEKIIQGNQLIDGNGTWCYQIPMNLDYYMTDEYGNFVPSDDKEKGIPTRTRVRFRVSLTDFQSDYENNHLAKLLVPNNPKTYEEYKETYHFGSKTSDDEEGTKSYRDLFWNKIYTVKQYIPRIQKGNGQRNVRFTGIKNVNVNDGKNPIPYNNIRINLTFMFVLQCAIIKIVIAITAFVNWLAWILTKISSRERKACTTIGNGICPDLENWYWAPGCRFMEKTMESIIEEEGNYDPNSIDYTNRDYNVKSEYFDEEERSYNIPEVFCIVKQTDYLMQCVEINLAMEYEVIQFDFYNDWINGLLYVPHWFVNYRKKRSFLFGLIKRPARLEACAEESFFSTRRKTQQCSMGYIKDKNSNFVDSVTYNGCRKSKEKCHKGAGRESAPIMGNGLAAGGLVHTEETLQGQKVYYFKPAQWLYVNTSARFMSSDGTYKTGDYHRCILWATDIVMLGSLNDCDEDGIPKIFEELVSSTFIMPTNLAQTNFDNPAFMYGLIGHQNKMGAYCSSSVLPGTGDNGDGAMFPKMEKFPQTFESYNNWTNMTDYYETLDKQDDVTEYPVTEASGIDWGYVGPNQLDKNGRNENNSDYLWQPGGHFLGISCFNAQTNIKSCVNLQRICEIGATKSQRQSFPRKNGNDFEYEYLMPNGLITRPEITDSDFRRVFATMNYNGLKTKKDEKTLYRKYDLKYIHPTNFDGPLYGRLYWRDSRNGKSCADNYINQYSDDSEKESAVHKKSSAKLYVRAIEESSNDYYYFRLGLGPDEEMAEKHPEVDKDAYMLGCKVRKYLKFYADNWDYFDNKPTNVVTMPQYENSFYFYFGLQDGNTAIDRFYRDFYAPCKLENEDDGFFTFEINDNVDICSSVDGASVTIAITNVDGPYGITLEQVKNGSNVKLNLEMDQNNPGLIRRTVTGGVSNLYHNYSKFKITNLFGGTYILTLSSMDRPNVSGSFTISETLSSELNGIVPIFENFKTAEYNETNNLNWTGDSRYISLGNVYDDSLYGILVITDEKYMWISTSGKGIGVFANVIKNEIGIDLSNGYSEISTSYLRTTQSEDGETKTYRIPTWKGNETYRVYYIIPCGTSVKVYNAFDDIYISMPLKERFNITFGDDDLNYEYLKYGLNVDPKSVTYTTNWVFDFIKGNNYSERLRWLAKKNFFYQNSMYQINNNPGRILYDYIPNSDNWKTTGYGERITTSNNKKEIFKDDYQVTNSEAEQVRIQNMIGEGVLWEHRDVSLLTGPIEDGAAGSRVNLSSFLLPTSYLTSAGTCSYFYKKENKGNVITDATEYEKGSWDSKLNRYKRILQMPHVQTTLPLKKEYQLNLNGDCKVKLPSIYRPFYANAILYINEEKEVSQKKYVAIVTNLVTYNGKCGPYGFNKEIQSSKALVETFNGDCTNCIYKSEDIIGNSYENGDEKMSFYITEGSPSKIGKFSVNNISISVPENYDEETIHFPCKEENYEFRYTEGIRFYYCNLNVPTIYIGYKDDKMSIVKDGNENVEFKYGYEHAFSDSLHKMVIKNCLASSSFEITFKTKVRYIVEDNLILNVFEHLDQIFGTDIINGDAVTITYDYTLEYPNKDIDVLNDDRYLQENIMYYPFKNLPSNITKDSIKYNFLDKDSVVNLATINNIRRNDPRYDSAIIPLNIAEYSPIIKSNIKYEYILVNKVEMLIKYGGFIPKPVNINYPESITQLSLSRANDALADGKKQLRGQAYVIIWWEKNQTGLNNAEPFIQLAKYRENGQYIYHNYFQNVDLKRGICTPMFSVSSETNSLGDTTFTIVRKQFTLGSNPTVEPEKTDMLLNYAMLDDKVIVGCKIDGTQVKRSDYVDWIECPDCGGTGKITTEVEGEEVEIDCPRCGGIGLIEKVTDKTLEYLNKIDANMVAKDWSNRFTDFFNGIYGNYRYPTVDVTNMLTMENINAVSEALSGKGEYSKWEAFKHIIDNNIGNSIFAVYDQWTNQIFDNDRSYDRLWSEILPDNSCGMIIKYYPCNNFRKDEVTPDDVYDYGEEDILIL